MQPLRILTWHVHGSYLYYLTRARHDFFLPVRPGRPAGYGGRAGSFAWGDNVRDVLSRACPFSLVRSVFEGKSDGSGLWETMVELDWPGLAIPQRFGGLGMGFVEVAIVAEELGRAVAPGPFLATVTQFVPAVTESRWRWFFR